jgi:N-acetylneuraminate synthase
MSTNSQLTISGRSIGEDSLPLVIAEIGINHEGDFDKAVRMVKDAHAAGAECVKFQCHVIEDEMTPHAQKTIPANSTDSIYSIMKRCALTPKQDAELKKLTESLGMIYLSTPFSRAAANILEGLDVKAYKIGSGECNNYPLVEHIAKFGKPIILSTGMNNIKSISRAVDILRRNACPFAILHCTSLYPTPYNRVRLGAIAELKNNFSDAIIGLSDHSLGNYTSFGAIALGASVIEKHFTSTREWEGPDVEISITPNELSDLIQGSKAIHAALGGNKGVLKEEQPTIDFAYASVVSIRDIKEGEKLSYENLWVKRPGTGAILAENYEQVINKIANKPIPANAQLQWEDFT